MKLKIHNRKTVQDCFLMNYPLYFFFFFPLPYTHPATHPLLELYLREGGEVTFYFVFWNESVIVLFVNSNMEAGPD